MRVFVKNMVKFFRYAAGSIALPYLLKLLKWLIDLIFGDVVMSQIEAWFQREKMIAWLALGASYMVSYPLRSAAFIALAVVAICAIASYFEGKKHHAPVSDRPGQPATATRESHSLPEHRPRVVPSDYKRKSKDSPSFGLFVVNPGYMALDVHIPSVPVGPSTYTLTFPERLANLGERDHTQFIEASLEHSMLPGLDGAQLHDVMRTSNIETMEFAILYQDTDFRWYRTNCVIERTQRARNGLEVRAMSQELMPDPIHAPALRQAAPLVSADSNPVIDGEVYRVVVTGKSAAAEMTRELYKAMGRVEEFAIDVDILVEMYIVNASTEKQYIRDFTATVEVDGKVRPLIRQNDFYAWEFSGNDYEYCLNPNRSENKFDRSELETLAPLYPGLPVELEARKPLEGWVRFLVKDVDSEKLSDNRSYKFVITDSLGIEHPIRKASTTKRRGEVSVRRIQ